MVVTEPICSIKLDIGNSEVWEWLAFDLIVLSIANEGAFTESFGMLATVPTFATSSLKLRCLPSTWTTWEEKEAQDPPAHLAVDEPYQCSEAHTAPAEVEDLVTNHGWRQHQETPWQLWYIRVTSRRVPPAPRLDVKCAGQERLFEVKEHGSGLLRPIKADWGQTWPSLALSWAEHKPTWAQLGRNLGRTWASWLQLGPNLSPTEVQHGATWAGLDASWV